MKYDILFVFISYFFLSFLVRCEPSSLNCAMRFEPIFYFFLNLVCLNVRIVKSSVFFRNQISAVHFVVVVDFIVVIDFIYR